MYEVIGMNAKGGANLAADAVAKEEKYEGVTYGSYENAGHASKKPEKPQDPTLPQTGQLNWPVPVLAVSGVVLFTIGWLICFNRKKES